MAEDSEGYLMEPEGELPVEEDEAVELDAYAAVDGDEARAPILDPGDADADRLRDALDALDEKVNFLLARHSLLAERLAAERTARREAEEKLSRLSAEGFDVAGLEERTSELETENERLARHAAYLEDRITSLLARVRYVMGS